MARQVIWSKAAEEDFRNILQYWTEKNGNDTYSRKIEERVSRIALLLSMFPKIGRKSETSETRRVIWEHYSIYYKLVRESVVIIHVWDSRRNPADMQIP